MKKMIITALTLALLPLGMQAQQSVDFSKYEGSQIKNSDFETWGQTEPQYWHSFESATGTWASFAKGKIDSSTTRVGGSYSCKLKASSLFGKIANGTMTTGQLNAGSTDAEDLSNHASLDISRTDKDNYGDFFYSTLTTRPVALSVWVQFTQKTAQNSHPYATVSAAITNGKYYQEPTADNDSSMVIGYAKNNEISSKEGVWQHLYVPFSYDSKNYNQTGDAPKAIMVTFSTNADPGQGSGGDVLLIDDLELIYTQQVTIPESGYTTFTNIAQKNHKVVMPEGIKGYALGIAPDGNLCIKKTYLKGDAIPAMASLLLVGNEGDYTFSTTLYQNCEVPALDDDAKLVQGSELNTPVEGYTYYAWHDEEGHTGFFPDNNGLKIQESEALLRVKADKAADSYQHILITPELTGDINDDGQQSIADITALVNRLLGKQEQSNKLFIPSADVNGDSSTTISDVTELVNILLGKGN